MELDGKKYQVASDNMIHNVLPNGTKAAVEKLQIIITSIKQDKTSYGYFTADGNLVLKIMMKLQIR
jgi:hypothetical protein